MKNNSQKYQWHRQLRKLLLQRDTTPSFKDSDTFYNLKNSQIVYLLENIGEGFLSLDRKWRFLYINPRAEEIFNKKYQDILGRSIWEIFPELINTSIYHKFFESLASNEKIEYKDYFPQYKKWLVIRTYPSQEGLLVHFQDITSYQDTLAQLEKNRQRLDIIQNAGLIQVFEWDIIHNDSQSTYLEQLYEVLFHNQSDVLYQGMETIHADDSDQLTQTLAESIEQKKDINTEFRVLAKDNTVHWMALKGHFLLDNMGLPIKMIGVNMDITSVRRAEEDLRQSEERFRLVVENSSDLIALLDTNYHYLYVSPSAASLLGYNAQELVGSNATLLIKPEDLSLGIDALDQVKGGQTITSTFHYRHKNGYYLVFEMIASSIRNEQGKPYMIAATFRDMTERLELEKKKDEFISTASHELKTPITTIKGFTQILAQFLGNDEKGQYYLTKINSQIDRLTKLINDLLDVSKIQSGTIPLELEPFDLNSLIHEVVEDFEKTVSTHSIVIEGSIHQQIIGDKFRIHQVIVNLINNAIKYSPQADKVLVKLSSDEQFATVHIIDFGIGLSKKDTERVFDRFFQAENKIRQSFSGLGLGLYISSEIIKQHGGTIWVESEKGKGSTFSFAIPFTASAD